MDKYIIVSVCFDCLFRRYGDDDLHGGCNSTFYLYTETNVELDLDLTRRNYDNKVHQNTTKCSGVHVNVWSTSCLVFVYVRLVIGLGSGDSSSSSMAISGPAL